MKRLMIYLLCSLFLVAAMSPAYAVDKKKTDKNKSTQVTKDKSQNDSSSSNSQSQKKYDDFIDKNQNGVDDRRENLVPKTEEPKSDNSKPAPKQDSTKKSPDDKK